MVSIEARSLSHLCPDGPKSLEAIPGPRSFPPSCGGRPFSFRSVSTRCLLSVASRFPAGFAPAPPGRDGLSSPRSVTSRLMLDFTGRWVSSSCFCVGPEGAASARGGVVPGSYSRHWWPVDRQTVVAALFFEPGLWESNEHKPDAGEKDGWSRLDFWFSGSALDLPKCLDWVLLHTNNTLPAR